MALITLRVLDGADRGRVFDDVPTPVTIGREEGNTIQLNDERISRFHLKIQEDREKIVLTDLESTNGTKVNGEDIQLRILRFGDMIALGRSVLLFGKREQIAERLAGLKRDAEGSGTVSKEELMRSVRSGSEEFDLNMRQLRPAEHDLRLGAPHAAAKAQPRPGGAILRIGGISAHSHPRALGLGENQRAKRTGYPGIRAVAKSARSAGPVGRLPPRNRRTARGVT